MKIQKIFIEDSVIENPQTQRVLTAFPKVATQQIRKVEDVFERVKKPYLQKRDGLNLFIGKKEGQLVKPAPDAYGLAGDPHYYFIHAYNCLYECEYCYLQGYFNSPDLVMFVNHDEIIAEMRAITAQHADAQTVWFHAGEFSDSLALSNITQEWAEYWDFFAETPKAKLELRTKSINIKSILPLAPLENIIISFSLSPEKHAKLHDRKTPGTASRLKAIQQLAKKGFTIGLHLDPIIYDADFESLYNQLISQILANVPEAQIAYISIGVVRFSKDSFNAFKRNYPESPLLAEEFVKSFDQKVRYNRPQRLYILKTVRKFCINAGIRQDKVYLCMEQDDA